MKNIITVLASFIFFATVTGSVRAVDEKPLPKLPWHLVDFWWNFDKTTPDFQSYAVDVHISTDIDSNKLNLYMSPVGLAEINGVKFYGGIQSNCNGWRADNPTDHKRVHGGKGAIFSRWSKGESLSLDNARAAENGFYESAGYEGDFVSVRRPVKWTTGDYTYELIKMDFEQTKDGDFSWVGCFLTDHQAKQRTFIGALRFPGRQLKFSNYSSGFVEIYSTSLVHHYSIAELPELEIRFTHPRINGQPVSLKRIHVYHPVEGDGNKGANSPPLMKTELSADGTAIVCHLYNHLIERPKNSYDLKLPEK